MRKYGLRITLVLMSVFALLMVWLLLAYPPAYSSQNLPSINGKGSTSLSEQ